MIKYGSGFLGYFIWKGYSFIGIKGVYRICWRCIAGSRGFWIGGFLEVRIKGRVDGRLVLEVWVVFLFLLFGNLFVSLFLGG